MASNKNVSRARSRSRSGRCDKSGSASSQRSSAKKSAKSSLPPGAPVECNHLPPPPYRPAGPFALFFAANLGTVEGKEVVCDYV